MIHAKKSVHVNITKSAHAGFRIECFKRGLSMQEAFEEFAQRVALESNDAIGILNELKVLKESKEKSDKKKDAELMGHDVETQNKYIKKDK